MTMRRVREDTKELRDNDVGDEIYHPSNTTKSVKTYKLYQKYKGYKQKDEFNMVKHLIKIFWYNK